MMKDDEQIMRERDYYHDMADKLADKIATFAGVDIGEHSNLNCPWENALSENLARVKPTEFCWLVDDGDKALGHKEGEICFDFLPYTDSGIVRFSRKKDAEIVINLMLADKHPKAIAGKLKAAEHGWN